MAAYRRVYDSRRLQADCQEPGLAPEPYLYLYITGGTCSPYTNRQRTDHYFDTPSLQPKK